MGGGTVSRKVTRRIARRRASKGKKGKEGLKGRRKQRCVYIYIESFSYGRRSGTSIDSVLLLVFVVIFPLKIKVYEVKGLMRSVTSFSCYYRRTYIYIYYGSIRGRRRRGKKETKKR